jgi:hypothetical protein
MNKFLAYIIGALIIYNIVDSKITEKQHNNALKAQEVEVTDNPSDSDVPMAGNIVEKSLSNILINTLKTPEGRTFFENMIQPKNKSTLGDNFGFKLDGSQIVEGLFKIQTIGEGTIGPVSCGHVVHAEYQILTMDNIIVEEGRKTFRIGSGEIMNGLENVIIGMYIGQTRKAVVLSQYGYKQQLSDDKKPGLNYQVQITLIDIIPKTFINKDMVKIFDDEIAYKAPCLCGAKVSFNMSISKINGEVIYDSKKVNKKIEMILGDLRYPMIISHSLSGKIPVGKRTVIAQGKYFRSLGDATKNNIFPDKQLPMDEYFLIEFSDLSEN